jgi:hypothetical protein
MLYMLTLATTLVAAGPQSTVAADRIRSSSSQDTSHEAVRSLTGEVTRVKSRSVYLRIEQKSRDVVLDDRTILLDANGHTRATGVKTITPLLPAGMRVRVTWVPYWVMDGDGAVTSYYRRALEIHTLP